MFWLQFLSPPKKQTHLFLPFFGRNLVDPSHTSMSSLTNGTSSYPSKGSSGNDLGVSPGERCCHLPPLRRVGGNGGCLAPFLSRWMMNSQRIYVSYHIRSRVRRVIFWQTGLLEFLAKYSIKRERTISSSSIQIDFQRDKLDVRFSWGGNFQSCGKQLGDWKKYHSQRIMGGSEGFGCDFPIVINYFK